MRVQSETGREGVSPRNAIGCRRARTKSAVTVGMHPPAFFVLLWTDICGLPALQPRMAGREYRHRAAPWAWWVCQCDKKGSFAQFLGGADHGLANRDEWTVTSADIDYGYPSPRYLGRIYITVLPNRNEWTGILATDIAIACSCRRCVDGWGEETLLVSAGMLHSSSLSSFR